MSFSEIELNQNDLDQILDIRNGTGLTNRCCEEIKKYVEEKFSVLPIVDRLLIAGEIGYITRKEAWSLVEKFLAFSEKPLDHVGVKIINKGRVSLQCERCGHGWTAEMSKGYWRCPNGCNAAK